jgi:hypothetical protein
MTPVGVVSKSMSATSARREGIWQQYVAKRNKLTMLRTRSKHIK